MGVVRKFWLVAASLVLSSTLATAQGNAALHQTILKVTTAAVLGLNDPRPVTLTVSVPANGRSLLPGQKNETRRLWYSFVNAVGTYRKITVRMSGFSPAGTSLSVEALNVMVGAGNASAGQIVITDREKEIITLIPSCATGRLENSGTTLRYSLNVHSPSSLEEGASSTVTVYYTLTDDG